MRIFSNFYESVIKWAKINDWNIKHANLINIFTDSRFYSFVIKINV